MADDADLRSRAPALWRTIQDAPSVPPWNGSFWLFGPFQALTAEEIWTMLNVLVPIEETRAYQSIFAKGKADGLKRLLARRFGPLSAWAAKRIDATAIDQLNAWLEGIFEAGRLENLIGPKSRRGKEAQRSSPPTLFPRHRQVRVEEEQGFPGMFRVVVTQRWRGGLGLSG